MIPVGITIITQCVYIIKLSVIDARLFNDLIIIDDSRLLGQITSEADDWSSITIKRIIVKVTYVKQFFEKEDRFVIYKQIHSC